MRMKMKIVKKFSHAGPINNNNKGNILCELYRYGKTFVFTVFLGKGELTCLDFDGLGIDYELIYGEKRESTLAEENIQYIWRTK